MPAATGNVVNNCVAPHVLAKACRVLKCAKRHSGSTDNSLYAENTMRKRPESALTFCKKLPAAAGAHHGSPESRWAIVRNHARDWERSGKRNDLRIDKIGAKSAMPLLAGRE